jgi:hypothetical protein
LRKPSQASWALNQVARRDPDSVARLLEAGGALRRAQDAVMSGEGDAAALREAGEAEREAAGPLLESAARVLGERGRAATPQLLERVRETLHAAAGDEEVARRLEAGRLVEDHQAVGLGGGALAAAPGRAAPRKPQAKAQKKQAVKGGAKGKTRDGRATATKPSRERAASAAADRRRRQAIAAAKKKLGKAEADAGRARRALSAAEHDRERAELAFRSADRAFEEARGRAEGAEAEAERLRAEIEGLEA